MEDNTSSPAIIADNRFSIVPYWIIFSGISDGALRLYMVLAKYANNETRQAFPARATLAKDIYKSRDSVDRYVKELEDLGALRVLRRKKAGSKQNQVNLYTLITANPQGVAAPTRPPRGMDAAENYTHLSIPNSSSSIAIDSRIDAPPLTPSPSGDGHTLNEQMGINDELKKYLIDIILALYRAGDWYWDEDNHWVTLESAFEEYLDLDIGDAVANRGWDVRLKKVMEDHVHIGERYAASVYLGMLHNYVKKEY